MAKALVLLVTLLGAAAFTAEGQLTIVYEPSGMSPPCPSAPKFTFTLDADNAGKLLKGECAKVSVGDKTDEAQSSYAGGDRYATLTCGSEDPGSAIQMAFYGEETCATAYENIDNMVECGSDYCPCDPNLTPEQSRCKTNDKNFDFQKSKLAISDASSLFRGNCVVAPGGLIGIHKDTLGNVGELPACAIAKTAAPTEAPTEANPDAECAKDEDCPGGGGKCGEDQMCGCETEAGPGKCDGICAGGGQFQKDPPFVCKECGNDDQCKELVGEDSKCNKLETNQGKPNPDYMMCTRVEPADNSACATAMFAPLLTEEPVVFKCWDTCAPGAEEGGGKAVVLQGMSACHAANVPGAGTQYMKYHCDASGGNPGKLSGGKFTRGDCDASKEETALTDAFPATGSCLKGPTDVHYHKAGECTMVDDAGSMALLATVEFFEDDACTTPVAGCKKSADAPGGGKSDEPEEAVADQALGMTGPAFSVSALIAVLYA